MSIQRLRELLIGTFDNKRQAYQNPTFYAHIRLIHKDIGNNLIYGEQAYTYDQGRPYRQFVIEPVMDGEVMKVKNYDLKKKTNSSGFKIWKVLLQMIYIITVVVTYYSIK